MGAKVLSIYVVARIEINPDEPIALAAYLSATGPLLEAAEAKIVGEYTLSEAISGGGSGATIMVVRYPTRDAVNKVFLSEEYRRVMPARDRAFKIYEVSIAISRISRPIGDDQQDVG